MVNSSSEHGLARVVHHKDYYLRGGDMTVMVSVGGRCDTRLPRLIDTTSTSVGRESPLPDT